MKVTGCDAVMLGRGALNVPNLEPGSYITNRV